MANKIYFVYSVPGYKRGTLLGRIAHSIRTRMFLKGYPVNPIGCRRPDENIFKHWPISSPYENTKNIYKALSKITTTYLYHLSEKVTIKFNSDDIFLGHPFFPFTAEEKGTTENAVYANQKPGFLGLITPLHCNTILNTSHLNKAYLDHVDKLVENADVIFGIMGEYWWNEWDVSPYAHWKPKMVRLDMAIDVNYYPIVKTKFNPSGKRRYLYIGHNNPNKGIPFLEELARRIGKENFGWIGTGQDIDNVTRIDSFVSLTPEYMEKIAEQYDFLISTSVADANPTTILEAMAWGFPVVCTQQSGYYETDYRFNIYSENIDRSLHLLNQLQYMPDDQLMAISKKARKIVESEYTWDKFTSTIISRLNID